MPLRRKRRRKREQRRHHESQPTPLEAARDLDDAWSGWTGAPHELEAVDGAAMQPLSENTHQADAEPPSVRSSSPELRDAEKVERLAYSRRQAAEALGVSVSTIDRRVVPSIDTVKTPWGQRLIPVEELERFMRSHLVPARPRPARRLAGRPATLPPSVIERIRLDYARGRGLAEIARALTTEGVPTAHGGRRWWPSTVRAVLVRSSSIKIA